MRTLLLLSAAVTLSGAVGLAQTVISVDLGTSSPLTSADTAGVVPVDNWTNPGGTPTFTNVSTTFDDGSASPATVSFAAQASSNATTPIAVNGTDANTDMFHRGKRIAANAVNGVDVVLSFDNLPTTGLWAGGYDVYLYLTPTSATTDAEPISVTDGSTTFHLDLSAANTVNYSGSFTQVTSTSSLSPDTAGNYVVFEGLTGSSASFNFGQPAVALPNNMAITGVQVVAVPEPTTAALLLGSVGMLLAMRRRRS